MLHRNPHDVAAPAASRTGGRRAAVSVVAGLLVASTFAAAPAAGVEPARPAEAGTAAAFERDRPTPPDANGDGLAIARTQLAFDQTIDISELHADGHQDHDDGDHDGDHGDEHLGAREDHDHDAVQAHGVEDRAVGTRIALPTSPEMLTFDHVAPDTRLGIRTRGDDGWDPWMEVHADSFDAPDGRAPGDEGHGSGAGIGPVWLGHGIDEVEVAVLDGPTEPLRISQVHLVEPTQDPTTPTRLRSSSTADDDDDSVNASTSDPTLPALVRPRSSWATSDMTWACDTGPSTTSDLRAVVVHHTAGRNGYAKSDVPGIMRAIWNYHVKTRGWCDVAYNFFVDTYGGIWEARQGGIDKAIIGGHTYGFNTDTAGVAQLGNFHTGDTGTSTPSAMTEATKTIVGWKLANHGVEPSGTTTLTNRSDKTVNGVPPDGEVTVPKVIGHRDLGQTSCPGDNTYNLLGSVRSAMPLGAHVYAIHDTFLKIGASPEQYDYWTWMARREGLQEAALGMARSEAYAGIIVTDLFNRVLEREPDEEGMAYWLGVLAAGTRVEEVGVYFYGSDEYYKGAGSPEDYVRALYRNLLHRDPDDAGLKYWADKLRAGATPPDVARGFYLSLESRRDRVARLYDTILGRAPDKSGHSYWAERLIKTDDIVLAVDLTMSAEYYERATA